MEMTTKPYEPGEVLMTEEQHPTVKNYRPLRSGMDLIRPSSLTVSAAPAGIRKTSPISDRVTTDTIERTLSCVIRLSPLCSCQAAITVDFCFIADNRFVVSYVKTSRLLISDDSGITATRMNEMSDFCIKTCRIVSAPTRTSCFPLDTHRPS